VLIFKSGSIVEFPPRYKSTGKVVEGRTVRYDQTTSRRDDKCSSRLDCNVS
jgi:hypothetical protein